MLAGSQALEDIAYATPARNRVMGSAGHNETVKYLVQELEALGGYYKIELQEFWNWVQISADFNLTVDGESVDAGVFDFSASGNVTAPIVVVDNLGCEPVSLCTAHRIYGEIRQEARRFPASVLLTKTIFDGVILSISG